MSTIDIVASGVCTFVAGFAAGAVFICWRTVAFFKKEARRGDPEAS